VPGIAGHLIACSVLGAPASLAIAKLVLPETEGVADSGRLEPASPSDTSDSAAPSIAAPSSAASLTAASPKSANVLEAIATGTADGIKLAVNVGAMLIVFLAMVAMFNGGLGLIGGWVGFDLSLERLFGWAFAPLAFFTGVPLEDVLHLGTLLGQKTALNEFVAYAHLNAMLEQDPTWLTERGRVIASYALCGFANFGSVGIQIASYSSLAPDRRADLSRLAMRAMGGGVLATTMIACVVGVVV
jgi:CNT family concentrative nucleoside transporter